MRRGGIGLLGGGLLLGLVGHATAAAQTTTFRNWAVVVAGGARVDWCRTTNLLVYDKDGMDGYADVYAANPDGSGEVCITCDEVAPNKHIGNPACASNGAWYLYQAQNDDGVSCTDGEAKPGRGLCNDLWIVDSGGVTHTKLYDVTAPEGGILHPQWFPNMQRIYWADRLDDTSPFGGWQICVASISLTGTPSLSGTTCTQPCPGASNESLYETHSAVDNARLYVTTICPDGGNQTDMAVYVYNVDTQVFNKIVGENGQWHEHLHLSPCGNKVAWMTSTSSGWDGTIANLLTDWWMANPDGTGATRITKWGLAGTAEKTAAAVVAGDLAWAPDCNGWVGFRITNTVTSAGDLVRVWLEPQARRARYRVREWH